MFWIRRFVLVQLAEIIGGLALNPKMPKSAEKRDQGIGLKGSVTNGIVAVFIVFLCSLRRSSARAGPTCT